jgi:hypothetical protein
MADGASNGGGTSISITVLDGIMNVNSLFTLAPSVGLTWNHSDGASTLSSPECAAGDHAESDLVTFHVLAFGRFLFSSLVASNRPSELCAAMPPQLASTASVCVCLPSFYTQLSFFIFLDQVTGTETPNFNEFDGYGDPSQYEFLTAYLNGIRGCCLILIVYV